MALSPTQMNHLSVTKPAPPPTVVHLITSLDNGGAEAMLSKVVQEGDKRNFRHVVISLKDKGYWEDTIKASEIELYSLRMSTPWSFPLAFVRLYRLLRKIQPDILQTWLYHADFLGTLVRSILPIPILVWNFRCSNMDLKQYPIHTRIVFRLLALMSSIPDGIAINSNKGLQHHQMSGFHPRNWFLIPNGFDTLHFAPNSTRRAQLREELGLPQDSQIICFPARHDAMKDHATFLRAAQILARERADVFFLLVGKGTDTQNTKLVQQIQDLGLQDRVLPLGQRQDMEHFLPALDIVGMSSAFGEGFPNVLGEAMACSVPCVATDVGDIREIIGQTGYIVPPRSPKDLADAWRKVLDLPPQAVSNLGAMARNRIQEKYSIQSVTQMYEVMYEGLIAGSKSCGKTSAVNVK